MTDEQALAISDKWAASDTRPAVWDDELAALISLGHSVRRLQRENEEIEHTNLLLLQGKSSDNEYAGVLEKKIGSLEQERERLLIVAIDLLKYYDKIGDNNLYSPERRLVVMLRDAVVASSAGEAKESR